MFVSLQQNRAVVLAFLACVIGAVGIFILAYLAFSSAPIPFRQIDVVPLPHTPPVRIEIASDVSVARPPETLPLYITKQNISIEDIRSFWELPEKPTRILSEGRLFLWQTERSSVTINLALAAVSYTNNAPSYRSTPFESVEEAAAFGEEHLETLPFLDGIQLKHVGSTFLKINNIHEEPGAAFSWNDAGAAIFTYNRLINGLPIIVAENPLLSLYEVTLDKRGAVLSVTASLIDVSPLSLPSQASPAFVPLEEVRSAIHMGAVTFVKMSDEAAMIDILSLQGKTVIVKNIDLGYLADTEEDLVRPVYIIKGTFDYYGREVEATALYPALSL